METKTPARRALAVLDTPPMPEAAISAKRISAKVRAGIEAMVTGQCKTIQAAAEKAGLSREHFTRELSKPHIAEHLRQKVLRSLAIAAARAGAVKGELLDSDNDMVRDRSSSFILGLSGIAPATNPSLAVNIEGRQAAPFQHRGLCQKVRRRHPVALARRAFRTSARPAQATPQDHPSARAAGRRGGMTGIIYKFPYNVSRRAYSRMGRCSKNETPEERAAKAAKAQPEPASLANVVQLYRKPVAPHIPPTPEETARFMALYNQMGPTDQALICDVLRGMVNNQSPQ